MNPGELVDTFAFIIHPIDPKRDISRKFPLLGRIATAGMVKHLAPLFPPVYLSEVEGLASASSGKVIKGWLIACPLTPQHFLELPEKQVYRKIIQTGHLAERLGAKILGLGAFTSVVGDAGITIAKALDIPVTTGDSYTVAVAIRAVRQAAQVMEIDLGRSVTAVVGATGAIGRVCAELLAYEAGELYLIGKRVESLDALAQTLRAGGATARLKTSTSMEALRSAQVVLTVTSSLHAVIAPEHLQPGSVVCDVARPRDVSAKVAATRQDILVIDGGMVKVPGAVDFHFDFGLPAGNAFACMAETIALALEARFEDYTLGKQLTRARVDDITAIADRHGFRLSGFRSFEKPVTDEHIDRVRQNAIKRQQ